MCSQHSAHAAAAAVFYHRHQHWLVFLPWTVSVTFAVSESPSRVLSAHAAAAAVFWWKAAYTARMRECFHMALHDTFYPLNLEGKKCHDATSGRGSKKGIGGAPTSRPGGELLVLGGKFMTGNFGVREDFMTGMVMCARTPFFLTTRLNPTEVKKSLYPYSTFAHSCDC